MQNHKDLRVWQLSMDLTVDIYKMTASYPQDEVFGLVSQMRRAAVSISSNIAEGYGKGGDKEIVHFLKISSGSACEIDTQLMLSYRLGYIDEETYNNMYERTLAIRKMLNSLISFLKTKSE